MSRTPKATDVLGRKQIRTATLELDALATRAEGEERIPVALSSDTPVERRYGYEVLVHTREAVDLTYATDGLPFLDGHDSDRQIGLVEDVGIGPDGKLRGMLRMGNHPDAAWIFRDIEAGIRRNISVGYRIDALEPDENQEDLYRATRWTPMEGSTVSIPADITVGVGRSVDEMQDDAPAVSERVVQDEPAPKAKERTMSEQVNTDSAAPDHKPGVGAVSLAEKQKEMADVARMAREHGMEEHLPAWFERGLSKDQVASEILARKRETATKPVDVPGYLGMSERDGLKFSYTRAISNLMNERWAKNGGFEKDVSDSVAKRLGKSTGGFFVPLDMPILTRAAVTGNVAGTSSLGGAGVQTSILSLIDLLRNKMLVRNLGATVLSGLTGNISFPRHIVANTMAWEGENPSTAHANTAATLDNVTLSPKTAMASSAYSRQLLIQESFDVSSFIQNDLAVVLALGLDLAAMDGTGANNQPTGVMRQTGVTTIDHGTDGAIPTWAKLVSYETAVATNNAEIGTLAWVTTPGMRGALKGVLKSTTAGSAYLWGDDNTMNGYRAEVTNQMPSNYTRGTSTTVAHGIIFGVWSELLIGEWGGALEVVIDPYSSAKQGMVEITQMIMADVAVRHPKAFAISKSALIA